MNCRRCSSNQYASTRAHEHSSTLSNSKKDCTRTLVSRELILREFVCSFPEKNKSLLAVQVATR